VIGLVIGASAAGFYDAAKYSGVIGEAE
jgi:hypothetical protein